MRFELTFKIVLKQLFPDGTSSEIVGVSRVESFDGDPKDFKDHYNMVNYKIGCVLDNEFDKMFPKSLTPPAPDEIPF